MDRLRRAAVRLALANQPSEELPMLAAEALAAGVDSPALRELAGLSRSDASQDLFIQAMTELGHPIPGRQDAWRRLMLWEAEALLEGTRQPYQAGHEIYWCACHLERSPHIESVIVEFLGLWSTWEDHPIDREATERAMREAAARLLAHHQNPQAR
ncbi:hypothetical protein P3T35_005310 [Kitasatospora sp. GP30]|uniref:hypothetical protein n=1 Tax=Kitasatospora sp. GP30 TaxID=3035084 RepID=UPI000CAD3B42|nr:hypothetical protein [Kitasatospora sp. GP30]MDH6143276.1 hypothetical protein [Kitasatospora sp. GP30]